MAAVSAGLLGLAGCDTKPKQDHAVDDWSSHDSATDSEARARADEATAQHQPRSARVGRLGSAHSLGAAHTVDRVTVHAVFADSPRDVGAMMPLSLAIERGYAVVREMDAEGDPTTVAPTQPSEARSDRPATVGTLVIENRGAIPILVLAGTLVVGGKQDRQVGEDLVLAPGKSADIQVYCVEQGRWADDRAGQETKGRFQVASLLTPSIIRSAAEYDGDQHRVWDLVASLNAEHNTSTPSGTFLGAVDNSSFRTQRQAIAVKLARELDGDRNEMVGLAYGVGGEVRGVKWFASPRLFAQFESTLLETAAFEALTIPAKSQSAPSAQGYLSLVGDLEPRAPVDSGEASARISSSNLGHSSTLSADVEVDKDGNTRRFREVITVDFVPASADYNRFNQRPIEDP
ncbi:MAG: DUF6569 family protein [Polyangiaceae bacterium]